MRENWDTKLLKAFQTIFFLPFLFLIRDFLKLVAIFIWIYTLNLFFLIGTNKGGTYDESSVKYFITLEAFPI